MEIGCFGALKNTKKNQLRSRPFKGLHQVFGSLAFILLNLCSKGNEKITPPKKLGLQNGCTLFKGRKEIQWTERLKQRDVINHKERETGSGAELRREWLLEVGHSSTDVIQSDVQRGGDGLAPLSASPFVLHTHTQIHTHALTLTYISSAHWVNNTCAEVKIAYLCIVRTRFPLSLCLSLSALFTA